MGRANIAIVLLARGSTDRKATDRLWRRSPERYLVEKLPTNCSDDPFNEPMGVYIAPLLFVVCVIAMLAASLLTPKPPQETVDSMTWSPAFFRDEIAEVRTLPWYQNYRILSAILADSFLVLLWLFR